MAHVYVVEDSHNAPGKILCIALSMELALAFCEGWKEPCSVTPFKVCASIYAINEAWRAAK